MIAKNYKIGICQFGNKKINFLIFFYNLCHILNFFKVLFIFVHYIYNDKYK